MFQPSSLVTFASYQATGPSHGWCEFTLRRATPSAERLADTAWAFDPGNALSARLSSSRCERRR